jgi:hypothetical protein
MKLSTQHANTPHAKTPHATTAQSSLEAALRLVDAGMARIVAEIGAHRPAAPAPKPRSARGRPAQHATA